MEKTDHFEPDRCTFNFLVAEAGAHFQSRGGFTLDFGVPLAGAIPVGPGINETRPHEEFVSIATPELAILTTVMVGWSLDL